MEYSELELWHRAKRVVDITMTCEVRHDKLKLESLVEIRHEGNHMHKINNYEVTADIHKVKQQYNTSACTSPLKSSIPCRQKHPKKYPAHHSQPH